MDIVNDAVDRYAQAHTTALGPELAAVAAKTERETPYPGMMGGLAEARLLQMLVVAAGARVALEIGTFTGFSALAMAAAMPDDGRVITIEADERMAARARGNIDTSPQARKITLIVGDAREVLADLPGPFDVVWIDAWKPDYPHYYDAVVPKLAPRGVIAADNVLRSGTVADTTGLDDHQRAQADDMTAFNDHVNADPRTTNALLTVGDGVMVAWRAPQS